MTRLISQIGIPTSPSEMHSREVEESLLHATQDGLRIKYSMVELDLTEIKAVSTSNSTIHKIILHITVGGEISRVIYINTNPRLLLGISRVNR